MGEIKNWSSFETFAWPMAKNTILISLIFHVRMYKVYFQVHMLDSGGCAICDEKHTVYM